MQIGMTLKGGKELEKKLLRLETKVARKVVRKAVRKSLKPEHVASKSNARSMVGGSMGALIARNMQLRAFKKQKKGSYGMSVKIKSDVPEFVAESSSGKRNYIPSAIEYGHAAPGDAGGTKIVAANPFMRAAADPWKKVGVAIFNREIKKGIDEVARGR